MPYRAKETIHSDSNPLADPFNGRLVGGDKGSFQVAGAGGIITDADAERLGLSDSDLVEKLEEGQIERELDEANLATVGAQFRAQFGDVPAAPQTVKADAPEPARAKPASQVLTSKGTAKAKAKK